MNARFDLLSSSSGKNEQVIAIENDNECSSPLGLSSHSNDNHSLTTNLIAQKFSIAPNDPLITSYMGDEQKGDLVKSFFDHKPLHAQHPAKKRQRT